MRTKRWLTLSMLLLLVAAVLFLPARARAITPPSCLLADQQCVDCGYGCQALCSYYDCEDGSQRVSCGSCNCIYQCTVP